MKLPWLRNREIDEEIETHLRMAADDGVAPRECGNQLLVRETTRDVWGWMEPEKFARDLRYALRQLRRTPGFSAVAILTLALGFGAATAMFSIVNGILLEPMKYRDPGRLYSVVNLPAPQAPSLGYWLVNARHYYEWRTHCRSCDDIALATNAALPLTGSGEPEEFPALRVSYNFFRTLGVQPALGRDFRLEEELPGQDRAAVLSDALWRARFASDPRVIGREARIAGEPVTIVGVMPPDFRLPVGDQWGPARFNAANAAAQPAIFLPLGRDISKARGDGGYNYVSVLRLKPGATPAQAAAEFQTSISDFVREFHIGLRPALFPLREIATRRARAGLWLLLGAVGAVLLIVCVNIGNLMLARAAGRDREAGIRIALGSSRGELFRLVLSEAFVLVATGSALGMAVAYAGLKAFIASAPVELPRIAEVHMDGRVLLFAIAAVLASTLICGLFPAWRLARTDPQESLKGIGKKGRTSSSLSYLVSAEVALSTLLLVVGGLLLLSFHRVMRAPKGFDAAHTITQEVPLIGAKYRNSERLRFEDEALRRLAAIPGVQSVGVTNRLPLRGETWICSLFDMERKDDPHGLAPANFRFVSPGYWAAMGIPLKAGRLITAADRGRGVAVIDEQAARLLAPGQDPIGKRVGGCGDTEGKPLEVIGVVGGVRAGAEEEPPVTVYQPYWDTSGSDFGKGVFVVRAQADLGATMNAVRHLLRSLDPDAPLARAETMDQIVEESVAARRFETALAVAFAMAGLALASLGVYGVISFAVARRTPEIGIRMALGARAPQLAAMVLRQGMTPVLIGLVAGLTGALLTGRFVAGQLYGVAPNDPFTISAVALVLLGVAAAACWVPACRAMEIDPQTALRFE